MQQGDVGQEIAPEYKVTARQTTLPRFLVSTSIK